MADTRAGANDLHDGVEVSSTSFQSRRADVMFFVNAGGVAYVTQHGSPRMALVPVDIGRAYEAVRRAGAGNVDAQLVEQVLAAFGIDMTRVQGQPSKDGAQTEGRKQ